MKRGSIKREENWDKKKGKVCKRENKEILAPQMTRFPVLVG